MTVIRLFDESAPRRPAPRSLPDSRCSRGMDGFPPCRTEAEVMALDDLRRRLAAARGYECLPCDVEPEPPEAA